MTDDIPDLSCPDWADRLAAGKSLLPDGIKPYIDAQMAQTAVRIFNQLRLPDVPGMPYLADAAGDWQRDVVTGVLGTFNPKLGTRAVTEAFVLVPKKNSKTTAGAAIMLTAVILNRRPRAEFVIIAPTHEIAAVAFSQAVGMVESDPVLEKLFVVQQHTKRITYRKTGAYLKIKTFDPKVVTGSKPSGILLDETHVIAEQHDSDRVIGQLRGGMISQPEAFLIQITTQSERQPSGVFLQELKKARAVRDGKLRARILPILYEMPAGRDWRDVKNWPLVLPNLGRSIQLPRLETDYAQAVEAGEEELRRWASQHLNVEIGVALMDSAWAGAMYWERRTRPMTLEDVLEQSEVAVVGIDAGGLDDLLGVSVIGRRRDSEEWLAWQHCYCHTVALERRKIESPRYRDFEAAGDLTICDVGDDVQAVADIVQQVSKARLLHKVAVDQAGIGQIVQACMDRGIKADEIVGIPQGWRMNGAIQTVERKLAEGTFTPAESTMMNWQVGNARVEPKGNAILITKQVSGRGKIDAVAAMMNAATVMMLNPPSRSKRFQSMFL